VIAARRIDPGDWVSPGTPALELVADGRTEVLVRVEPELLADVDVGTEATISRGSGTAPARVAGVVRALDEATRTAQLRLEATEDAPWLLAGAAVDVRFELVHEGDGVIVPRDALVEGVAQSRVVKVVDGQAQPVVVEVLERGVDEVRVRAEGLSAEDTLVVRGNDRLRPGQPVRVAEDE
jgi:multidrug resistance efflux pump